MQKSAFKHRDTKGKDLRELLLLMEKNSYMHLWGWREVGKMYENVRLRIHKEGGSKISTCVGNAH